VRTHGSRCIGLVSLGLLTLPACHSFGPPQPSTLQRLQPMPLAALLPGRFEVELESPGLTGTFDAIAAVVDGAMRLQLFPDVGGKVLDLEVGTAAVRAELPGSSYVATAPLDRAEPHLALVFAVLVAELVAPVAPARVRGERLDASGRTELELVPALGSGRVVVALGPDGVVQQYEMELGWLAFTLAADGSLLGRGIKGWIRPQGG
jgi:hypothetical protein